MDRQEKMIQEIVDALSKLYYEDFAFMHPQFLEIAHSGFAS